MYVHLWRADSSCLSDLGFHRQRQLMVVARHGRVNYYPSFGDESRGQCVSRDVECTSLGGQNSAHIQGNHTSRSS